MIPKLKGIYLDRDMYKFCLLVVCFGEKGRSRHSLRKFPFAFLDVGMSRKGINGEW